VKTAHTPGGALNDPLSAEILERANRSVNAGEIVGELLSIEKIFDRDLPANAAFRAELTGRFIDLAQNPALATAGQIRV
jgi:mannitol-1-phosphate/altronate dehydrogenase